MIENREQRKKSSLFRRRVIFISVFAVVLVALIVTLAIVYNFVNTVIYYVDTDANATEYVVKNVEGTWAMYDADGNLLPKENNFGCYVTKAGNLVRVNEETGKCTPQASLEISDGELASNTKILIFGHVAEKNILSLEVHNEKDDFTFYRYNVATKSIDPTAAFVYRSSPQLTIRRDAMTALASDAGYALAADRVDDPVRLSNGKIDFSEYGLVPEKRTRTVVDEDGNETVEEYDYTPAYYILTTTDGVQHKMLLGDRLVNGGGYYAQYIEIKNGKEIPREKVYVFSSSLSSTLLAEAKNFITPGISYPVTQSDYFDVTDFEIKKLNPVSNEYDKMVGFTFIDTDDRTDTVRANKPYVFNDERSSSYHPNFDRIDACLLSFMDPEIVDTVALHPSNKDLADFGLMSLDLDENGAPILDENGKEKYVFSSKYKLSFKRKAKISVDDSKGNTKEVEIEFLQTVYISEKNDNGNYYSYTTIDLIGSSEAKSVGVDLDMICEVKGETFNFLNYSVSDWTYPAFMETGIKYSTKLEITKGNYSASFDINNIKKDDRSAISINASNSLGKKFETFGMLLVADASGSNYTWYVSRTDVKLFKGETELEGEDMQYGTNALGERTKYLVKPFMTADGRIVHVNVNTIKIIHPDDTVEEYTRYHTMIFQKLFQSINSMRIAGEYTMEDEAAFLADPANLYATIALTDNEEHTIKAEFYKLTERKFYVVVNGEGGYYVNASTLDNIFENSEKFFNCQDIDI